MTNRKTLEETVDGIPHIQDQDTANGVSDVASLSKSRV
jgi:hypothetical protein